MKGRFLDYFKDKEYIWAFPLIGKRRKPKGKEIRETDAGDSASASRILICQRELVSVPNYSVYFWIDLRKAKLETTRNVINIIDFLIDYSLFPISKII